MRTATYSFEFENDTLVVFDRKRNYKIDLSERLLEFSVKTIPFLGTMPSKSEYDVIKHQLSTASTSVGANYEESQATTPKEFHYKISICLREARETHYWYKLIDRLKLGNEDERNRLLQEADELKRIFGSIKSKIS